MKNIFRKITAIAASALMVGMTMGVAGATTYPAPFVEGGSANVAIIYGTGVGVAESDLLQAGYIRENLASSISAPGATPSGDNVLLEKTSDKFNLQNNMSTFYSKLDEDELSTILADGEYTNDAHNNFDYTQEIVIASGLQLTHFLDSKFNDEKPVIGFDLAKGAHLLNYTLEFTDDAEGVDASWTGITGSELPLFSTPYYVLAMTNTSGTNHKITLLNSAVSATLNSGESITLTTDGGSYAVSVTFNDGNKAVLMINDVLTDSLAATETQRLPDGSYVGIKDVASEGVDGQKYVEFSIGTGKLVLENTKEVEMNSEKLSVTKYPVVGSDDTVSYKVTSYITTDGYNIDKIVLDWQLDDDSWIAPGTEMVIPGFETIKLSMNEFITSVGELTTFKGDSNSFEISTVITDGAITLPIFYMNSTSAGIDGLGKDSGEVLSTGNASSGGTTADTGIMIALNGTLDSYFVVTWIDGDDSETYVYELDSVTDENKKNKTVLRNVVSGGTITLKEETDSEENGHVRFTLDFAREDYPSDEYVILNLSAVNTGKVYTNRLVTADGLMITLPVEDSAKNPAYSGGLVSDTGNGLINTTATAPITWTMNVTEEDSNDKIGVGKSFTIKLDMSSTEGLEPTTIAGSLTSATMWETYDGSKLYLGYVKSDLSTKLLHDKPTGSSLNDLDVTYFGSETYAEVFLTEASSVMVGADDSLGSLLVMDSQVSTVSSRNLIVVGGSCINSAAATLLGGSAKCGSDFTTATGIGSGQFLIQSFGDVFSPGKIALLVAGYDAPDTGNAVTYLRTNAIDTTKDKKYRSISSTAVELVVE